LSSGCYPFLYNKIYDQIEDFLDYVDEMINAAMVFLQKKKIISSFDKVLVVHGWSAGTGHTNTMRVVSCSRLR